MKKQIVLFGVVFTIAIIGVTSYMLYASKESPKKDYLTANETQQVAQNSQLQVQGDSTPQQQTPQFPSPDQFSQYEQYSQNQAPLILDLREGTGAEAMTGDTVAMVYTGYLTNGQIFDQSRTNELNQLVPFPFTIGSGQVIQGWELGIPGMKVGGQRRLIIPSQFGYGPTGQASIPANSMLIFDVELVAVENEQQP